MWGGRGADLDDDVPELGEKISRGEQADGCVGPRNAIPVSLSFVPTYSVDNETWLDLDNETWLDLDNEYGYMINHNFKTEASQISSTVKC